MTLQVSFKRRYYALGFCYEATKLLRDRPVAVDAVVTDDSGPFRPLSVVTRSTEAFCHHSASDLDRAFSCTEDILKTGTTNPEKLYAVWTILHRVDPPEPTVWLCAAVAELTQLCYETAFEWAKTDVVEKITRLVQGAGVDIEPLARRWEMADKLDLSIYWLDIETVQAAYAMYAKWQHSKDEADWRLAREILQASRDGSDDIQPKEQIA